MELKNFLTRLHSASETGRPDLRVEMRGFLDRRKRPSDKLCSRSIISDSPSRQESRVVLDPPPDGIADPELLGGAPEGEQPHLLHFVVGEPGGCSGHIGPPRQAIENGSLIHRQLL